MSEQGIRVVKLPNHELMETVRSLTRQGLQTLFPIRGRSMRIFVEDGRDKAILAPFDPARLKKGDVVLAWVEQRRYVLHRIIRIENQEVTLMGDGNLQGVEHCQLGDIRALATHVLDSRGRRHDLYSPRRMRAVRLWLRLRPVRRYLLAIYRLFHHSMTNNF